MFEVEVGLWGERGGLNEKGIIVCIFLISCKHKSYVEFEKA
jgi:hypothetical protein